MPVAKRVPYALYNYLKIIRQVKRINYTKLQILNYIVYFGEGSSTWGTNTNGCKDVILEQSQRAKVTAIIRRNWESEIQACKIENFSKNALISLKSDSHSMHPFRKLVNTEYLKHCGSKIYYEKSTVCDFFKGARIVKNHLPGYRQ